MFVTYIIEQLRGILISNSSSRVCPWVLAAVFFGIMSILIGEGLLVFYAFNELVRIYELSKIVTICGASAFFMIQGIAVLLYIRYIINKSTSILPIVEKIGMPGKVLSAFIKGFNGRPR